MSAFLGPIHYWLYQKIQIQQKIIEEIINSGEVLMPQLRNELDERYGESETRPLEEVIDQDNIHGWLQQRVAQVEYKLAYSVAELINRDPDIYRDLELIFEEKGNELSWKTDNAAEAYKGIGDSLLDGMPCDHANTLLQESEDKVIWKRNHCVHKDYWEEAGGDMNLYYSLREAFIRGFLKDSPLAYEKMDEITHMIKRRSV